MPYAHTWHACNLSLQSTLISLCSHREPYGLQLLEENMSCIHSDFSGKCIIIKIVLCATDSNCVHSARASHMMIMQS